MREGQVKKIPYLLVVGDQEVADGTVNVRCHGQKETRTMSLDEFIAMLQEKIESKSAEY